MREYGNDDLAGYYWMGSHISDGPGIIKLTEGKEMKKS